MSAIFLPLRSNAAWFASQDYRQILEQRLKNLALVYDQLVFQDGRYHRVVGESNAFDMMMPPGQIQDRSKLRFTSPGTPFRISVAETGTSDWHALGGGPALVNYDVDFFPLFSDAGLLQAPYIDWRTVDISGSGKADADRLSSADKRSEAIRSILPNGRFLQDGIINGLYIDSILAADQSLPMSVDYHVAPLIENANSRISSMWAPDLHGMFQNTSINLGLIDVGGLPWEAVDRARESDAGRGYRELIETLTERAVAGLEQGANPEDIQNELQRLIVRELVEEVIKRTGSIGKTAFNIGLNFIPLATLVTGAADIANLLEERRSWVTLLNLKGL